MKQIGISILIGVTLTVIVGSLYVAWEMNRQEEQAERRLAARARQGNPWFLPSVLEENHNDRASAMILYPAVDEGVIFPHGHGPGACDILGARDVTIFEENGVVYLGYDGAGPEGWVACLASSRDLVNWTRHGPILKLGLTGKPDARYAGYPVLGKHANRYFCYYVGAEQVTGIPWRVPAIPYTTQAATAERLLGPWQAAPELAKGLELGPMGSFDELTVTPGPIFTHQDKHWMIYSAAGGSPLERTLGLASAPSPLGPWTKEARPLLPPREQIENAALYFEPANKTWFLFTNHVTRFEDHEFTDAIWVYWTDNPLHWKPASKAALVWSVRSPYPTLRDRLQRIGLPTVLARQGRLYIVHDRLQEGFANPWETSPDAVAEHCHRDIAVVSLSLPLRIPGGPRVLDLAEIHASLQVAGPGTDGEADRPTNPQDMPIRDLDSIKIDGVERRRVVLMHPPPGQLARRYQSTGHVPAEGLAPQLFSIAIHPDVANKTDGAEFRMLVSDQQGAEHELFRRFLQPRERPEDRGWIDASVDLKRFAGQEITVRIETRSGPAGDNQNDWALWSFSALPLRIPQ